MRWTKPSKPRRSRTHRTIGLVVGLLATAGCSRAAKPPTPLPAVGTVKGADARPSQPIALPRTRTGAAGASLSLVNAFPIEQHVFVDGNHLGSVAAGTSAAFAVPLGSHDIICADSADPASNPTRVTAVFEPGYEYTYRLSVE